MQFITSGMTRFVILTDRYAIKIARIKIFHCIKKTLEIVGKGQAHAKLATYRATRGGVKGVLYQFLCSGIEANFYEHRRTTKYPRCKLVPTLKTFGYFINVQKRGDTKRVKNIDDHPVAKAAKNHWECKIELDAAQFCYIGEELLLADYGYPKLEPILASI